MINIILLMCISGTLSVHWDYDREDDTKTGPKVWGNKIPTCKGNGQSPINIDTGAVEYDDSLTPFTFKGFDTAARFSFKLKNNGHSAQVDFTTTPPDFEVSGGGLGNSYTPAQFHFHWGSKDEQGSEHFIDNKQYPLEMHIVLYKSKHPNITAAVKSGESNDLAVLGFLFETTKEDNTNLEILLEEFSHIIQADTSTISPVFPLTNIIGSDPGGYYRYMGSLTTPTCNEVVVWTIFEKTIPISSYQLEWFRMLENSHGHPLEDNYRPLQEINDRKVLYSSSINFTGSSTMLLVMLVVTYLFKN